MISYSRENEPDCADFPALGRGAKAIRGGATVSAFAGIAHMDGAPVDPALLRSLTNSLSLRGPDAQQIWYDGPVGFGHALLQAPRGAPLEKQPAALDGRLWIVADARIDARAELIGKLHGKSRDAEALSLSTPDAGLILQAYDAWGEACVEHLLGDFTFAIWDARRKRLFCARDQFGIKQLYYAQLGSSVIFSNTLNCIRFHPGVSSRLNDLAIADFLLFELNQDPSSTSFAEIRQVPAAHTLLCGHETLRTQRYWNLPFAEPIHFSRDQEYVERFRELLDAAVADRVRGGSAGILMSGGLDSTAVAASARRVFGRNGNADGLRAFTEVFDTILPDEERHYASLAASALHIPIEYLVSDHRKIFERAEEPGYRLPFPMHLAWPDTSTDQLRQVAATSNVALTGFGADPAFSARITVHLRQWIGKGRPDRALLDLLSYLRRPGRLSRLYLRTRWHRLFPPKTFAAPYPEWLNPDLEKRFSLRDRWVAQTDAAISNDSNRPEAYEAITNPQWTNCFEMLDTSVTQVPVEIRHPFFDLQLLKFLLALPALPWCCDKELLREAARGTLPDALRLRRKSPMAAEPLNVILRKPESEWVDGFKTTRELEDYVSPGKIPSVYRESDTWAAWVNLRPLSLNYWLRLRNF
jgi:asparagine synthase (glutamine-hydrolysing)